MVFGETDAVGEGAFRLAPFLFAEEDFSTEEIGGRCEQVAVFDSQGFELFQCLIVLADVRKGFEIKRRRRRSSSSRCSPLMISGSLSKGISSFLSR